MPYDMARDDEIIRLHERVETARDDTDLETVYNKERQLLCSVYPFPRSFVGDARSPTSEFLDDLRK